MYRRSPPISSYPFLILSRVQPRSPNVIWRVDFYFYTFACVYSGGVRKLGCNLIPGLSPSSNNNSRFFSFFDFFTFDFFVVGRTTLSLSPTHIPLSLSYIVTFYLHSFRERETFCIAVRSIRAVLPLQIFAPIVFGGHIFIVPRVWVVWHFILLERQSGLFFQPRQSKVIIVGLLSGFIFPGIVDFII